MEDHDTKLSHLFVNGVRRNNVGPRMKHEEDTVVKSTIQAMPHYESKKNLKSKLLKPRIRKRTHNTKKTKNE